MINHRITLFVLLTILIPYNSFGQIVFEKGYFINNDDQKTECLIKNYEWKTSPTQIEYKLTEGGASFVATIDDVKEFGVSNYKYLRFTIDIDQSGQSISDLSDDKEPVFAKETLFLRTVIEGSASLFSAAKQKRYFYSVKNSDVIQLIYKEYLANNRVLTNNAFKSQLWESLKCDCITLQDIEKTGYNKNDLIRIFEKFNNCFDTEFVNYDKKNKKVSFNLGIRPGIRIASLSIKNAINNSQNIDFANDLNFCLGIEAAFILPFNKNKWAITFEPTYQYYKAEDPRTSYSNGVNYHSIELPVGIVYSIFLSNRSRIFASLSVVVLDIPFNSRIGSLDINTAQNLNVGIGYSYRNKYSLKLQYGSPRKLLTKYTLYSSSYQSISITLGFNFF